jgi:hypothetical protein
MRLFLFLILFPIISFAQNAPTSYVAPTRVLAAKGYQLGAYVDYFTRTELRDDKGKKVEEADDYKFNRVQTEVSGQYGATNDLQFGLGFRFRQNVGTQIDREDVTQEVKATGSGLQSTFLNLMFAFKQVDRVQYTLEGTFRYSPYTNNEYEVGDDQTIAILGDTGNEYSAGLGMSYIGTSKNYLTVRGGYRRPGSEISDEIYWQAEGAMAWSYIALVAGVDGVTSLKNDPYENDELNRPDYNSPTYLYNVPNREWITPYAGINIALGNSWRVELKGSQSIQGTSTDLGTTFGINLIRRVEKSETRLVDNKFKTYDLEATVTKISPKKEYVVIDKGIADDFNKGMRVDFFEFDYIGGNVLVATGVIIKTKSDSAIVKITQRFNTKKELKEGLIGRATLK